MSLVRHTKYKESGVRWLGEIPAHWTVLRLKHACAVFPSNVDKHAREDEPAVLLCNYTDVYYNERITSCLTFMQATASEDQIERFTLKAGDTIITKDSETADDIAIAAYVPRDLPGVVCGYHLSMVRPRGRTCGAFVKRLFDSVYAKARFEIAANGLTRVGLGQYALDNVEFPFPPLDEQTTIAAFLDRETAKIDALVAEQQRLIELLKEKRQAVISQAVTKGLNPNVPMKESGNQWIGRVPEHWTSMRLKHATARMKNAFVDGPFGSNLKSEHFIDDGEIYVIESGFATQGRLDTGDLKTISAEHFATISRSETRGGDIIIAKIGAQFGKSSILPILDKRAVVSGNSLKLTVNTEAFDVSFVNWHLVNLKALGVIEDIVNATAQPALSLGEMSNLPLVGPPLVEQREIVAFLLTSLGEVDGLMMEAKRGIDLLLERRSALISAAVTGKIDVRGLVPQAAAVAT